MMIAKNDTLCGKSDHQDRCISLTFCFSDNYAQHFAVALHSILAANPDDDFKVHVLHCDITEATISKLSKFETMFPRCELNFHMVSDSRIDAFPLPAALKHISREMYLRYFIPEVLKDESRTLYSDVDVLCKAPIRELWEMPLDGNLVGAVRNTIQTDEPFLDFKERLGLKRSDPYFFSGMLLMDLEGLRRGGWTEKLVQNTILFAPRLAWPDMDVINVTFKGKIKEIGEEWNCVGRYRPFDRSVKIWHFLGWTQKPWCFIWKNTTWIPYLRNLVRTPYASAAPWFVLRHIMSVVFCSYEKKGIRRYCLFGILIWKRGTLT